MKCSILVTGADGFIGSHLVESLVKDGYKVRAFCFYNSLGSTGWLGDIDEKLKDKIEIFLGDIRDPLCVKEAMRGVDIVFHLAALIAIPYSYRAPSSYVETNINGTLNILQAATDLKISKVVHTSTSEVYGTAQYVPINESHPLVGQSPYSATKIAADQLAVSFWRSFDTPVTILRPFNTYGPRQSLRAVIPSIIIQIVKGKKDINLGNLSPTRDFNYVLDTCEAFKAVAFSNKTIGEIINSASKFEISINDTVSLIADLMEIEVRILSDEKRLRPDLSEVNRLFGDNNLLKKLTDWKPKYEGIEGFRYGLEQTISWFSKKDNIAYYKSDSYFI